jgi:hypothetical protein
LTDFVIFAQDSLLEPHYFDEALAHASKKYAYPLADAVQN